MQQTIVPLYLDWTFWAVAVAATALVLSQLPPIYQLVRPGKLAVELYSRLHITHKVGNPNLQVHLILTNAGGRPIKIKAMTLGLRRDGKDVAVLPAQNYLQQPNDKDTVLFTSFLLKAKEEWAHIVNFLPLFARPEEKNYRAAERILKTDINHKRALLANKDDVVVADAASVQAFNRMFDELFIWQPGEYEAQLSIMSQAGKVIARHSYRFTLFESDSAELADFKLDFATGDGIYWRSGNHPGVIVQVAEA